MNSLAEVRRCADLSPGEVRALIRRGEVRSPTAGMARGYAQANLMILPGKWAEEFEEYARKNPGPCPLLEVLRGLPETHLMARDGDITRDIPGYYVYRNGVRQERLDRVDALWQEDFTGFLIGCSFSFEEALMQAGIEIRHIAQGRNVPMYRTALQTEPAGSFSGPMVCSMRPMTPENAERAREITARFPYVHGAPVQIGHPEEIGVLDLEHPDYGDPVTIQPGEIPVFWPCGVTPQAAVEQARPPIAISHAPGYMFITDVLNSQLNDFLAAHRK